MKNDNVMLLDCTLRDGGYITKWMFGSQVMKDIVRNMTDANLDFVELGYLNNKPYEEGSAQFHSISQIADFIPSRRKNSIFLAMADITQFTEADLTPYDGTSIDGIRVVFYKHQIKEALKFCEAVKEKGYKLFVQPMVTIDYTIQEYTALAERIHDMNPYAVSIVDSFGYMNKEDFRKYFTILDCVLERETVIGFHSHNNMQLAFVTAQDIMDYKTSRQLMIDSSLFGMGRAAGNLNTELITNYFNITYEKKYDIKLILQTISKYIMPIRQDHVWGYSPYLFLTGLYKCHPNFAVYLLEEEEISVEDFEKYLLLIPKDMRTKCRKPYVLELYRQFISQKKTDSAQ